MSTILFVEDEVSLRVALRFQLRGLGELLEAKDRQEALGQIQARQHGGGKIDLAIVDLQLPTPNGVDPDAGFTVVSQLGESFPDVAVIILTIRNDKAAWHEAQKHPSVRYFFTKPASSDALFVAACSCLAERPRPIFVGALEGELP
jgi:CheY-like chemotaxis protein